MANYLSWDVLLAVSFPLIIGEEHTYIHTYIHTCVHIRHLLHAITNPNPRDAVYWSMEHRSYSTVMFLAAVFLFMLLILAMLTYASGGVVDETGVFTCIHTYIHTYIHSYIPAFVHTPTAL